jgi:hypothetical protein
MKSSDRIGLSESICRKKSMKTWRRISPPIRTGGARHIPIRISTTAACRISWSSLSAAPGDLVTWDLGRGVPHIAIVVDQKSGASGRYMIVHNIGDGPKMEDVLFSWKITGHYRYFGPKL